MMPMLLYAKTIYFPAEAVRRVALPFIVISFNAAGISTVSPWRIVSEPFSPSTTASPLTQIMIRNESCSFLRFILSSVLMRDVVKCLQLRSFVLPLSILQ